MNFTYENQGINTYLVYTLSESETLDSMSLGMITNNRIPGLAPAMFMQMNAARYLKYNISSKLPARQFFAGSVNRKRLLGVFNGIADAILAAEEYMIDTRSIIMDLDYIYADVSTCETVLVCLPVNGTEPGNLDFRTFFRNIMFHTQFDQTENCDHVTMLINYLNSSSVFSMDDFKKLLTMLKGSAVSDNTTAQPVLKSAEDPVKVQPQVMQRAAIAQTVNQPADQIHSLQVSAPGNPGASAIPGKKTSPVPASGIPPAPPKQKKASSVSPNVQENGAGGDEKKISLLYLMQHYNKENAAAYKAQKAEKKQEKRKAGSVDAVPAPSGQYSSFPVPGQSGGSVGIALTGDQAGRPSVSGNDPAQSRNDPIEKEEERSHVDFGNTVFADDAVEDSDTVMLKQDVSGQRVCPQLLRKKNNEIIPVNKELFRLGRDAEFNDYAIVDNMFLGKSHCHIITRNGEYFLVDDNSKNHTYVNEIMVTAGSEVKLSHGQNIRLADEEFEFRLF